MKRLFKKSFTLIELIVVIVVIGILAAIVVPNISSWQKEADTTAIVSNVRNLQTSVDMYTLDSFGKYPVIGEQPTEFNPKPIDFKTLNPDYLRNNPKDKATKYWIDFKGKVWASTIDSPEGVEISAGKISWEAVEESTYYNVYKVNGYKGVIGAASIQNLEFVDKVETEPVNNKVSYTGEVGVAYVVSAVDENGFETAPSGIGYEGYPEMDSMVSQPSIPNEKPTAVISISPESGITTNTNIAFSYGLSTDLDGDRIVKAEWKGKQTKYTVAGEYTVQLRVQDEKGAWSDWVSKTFTVKDETPVTFYGLSAASTDGNLSTSESVSGIKYITWDGDLTNKTVLVKMYAYVYDGISITALDSNGNPIKTTDSISKVVATTHSTNATKTYNLKVPAGAVKFKIQFYASTYSSGQLYEFAVINSEVAPVTNITSTYDDHSITLNYEKPQNFSRVDIYENDVFVGSSSNGIFTHKPVYAESVHKYRLETVNADGVMASSVYYTEKVGSRDSKIVWKGLVPEAFDHDYNTAKAISGSKHIVTWDGNLKDKYVTVKFYAYVYDGVSITMRDANNQPITVKDEITGETKSTFSTNQLRTLKFKVPENATQFEINYHASTYNTFTMYEMEESDN